MQCEILAKKYDEAREREIDETDCFYFEPNVPLGTSPFVNIDI
jgi:hypothetical protein